MAVTALLKLAGFTNDMRYVNIIHQTLAQMQPILAQYPLGFGQWLQALSFALSEPRQTAIVCDPGSADTQALLNVVRDGYRPFQVVALSASTQEGSQVPLLQDRGLAGGQPTACVCRASACQAPVAEPQALKELLKHGKLVSIDLQTCSVS